MSLLGGWFRSSSSNSSSTDSLRAKEYLVKERENLADAMKWTSLIMNDDIDGASEGLERGDSSFHTLGAGVTSFMRSVLGFEKEVMVSTAAKLNDCETKAWADYKRVQKYQSTIPDRLYPPGTEYELVRAEAQLMGAVVGVLNESIVEAMKSFYKLRKAFVILDSIVAAETKASAALASERQQENGKPRDAIQTPDKATSVRSSVNLSRPSSPLEMQSLQSSIADANDEVKITDTMDVFIHSGTNMCFGLLLLILSLVPPAFSKILSVVGFHGDRARGIRMLWRAAAHNNINGALAGMMLLGYYNGLLGTVDILPAQQDYDVDAESVGPPHDKCRQLLADLRSRYPDSRMWRVEEARLYANDKNLPQAIELLATGKESPMKQITAVNYFELGINAMILQDWNLMRDTFLRCLTISDWSPGMYYYMAGCAALELYRDAKHNAEADADIIKSLKDKTEEYLREVPRKSGKQRLMARQLPLETFAQRKVQKWEDRAKTLNIDLADAVGSSPALEICYIWNGQKRMTDRELSLALHHLDWTRCTIATDNLKDADEVAVWAVTRASILQGQGKAAEAIAILEENVLRHDR